MVVISGNVQRNDLMYVRRILYTNLLLILLGLVFPAMAFSETAGEIIKSTSGKLLERLHAEKDQITRRPYRIYELVNELVVPRFDFVSISIAVLGTSWKSASEVQQQLFVEQFKTLLIRTYTNTLRQYADNEIVYYPEKIGKSSDQSVVRTEVRGIPGINAVPIHYRLRLDNGAWKVVDVSVDGISLVSTYRNSFASDVRKNGLDALISKLVDHNRRNQVTGSQD